MSLIASTMAPSLSSGPVAVFSRLNYQRNHHPESAQLVAVSAKGKATVFSSVTEDSGDSAVGMADFSMVGDILTAQSRSTPAKVYWWRLSGPRHTAASNTVPVGDRYLTSAPDGWVDIDPDGNLLEQTAGSDSTTQLAQPFGSTDGSGMEAVSGPEGVVVWNATQIAYVSFTTKAVTALDTSALTMAFGAMTTPLCWSVSTSAVACGSLYTSADREKSLLTKIFIDPLDGTPATATSTKCPNTATILGTTAAWLDCKNHLTVLTGTSTKTSKSTFASPPLSGLGGFLETTPASTTGVLVSKSLNGVRTILKPVESVTEVGGFGLGSGGIVWKEDEHGAGMVTLHRRAIHRNASHSGIKLGKVTTIGSAAAGLGPVAVDGSTVAFISGASYGDDGSDLRVVSGLRIHTITGTDGPVSIGAHRVVYVDSSTARSRIYNLKTRKTKSLAAISAVISSHYLAYLKSDGTILQRNLATSKIVTVAHVLGNTNYTTLYEYADKVGWNTYLSPPNNTQTVVSGYRAMAAGTPAVTLPGGEGIWSLTSAGLITEPTLTSPGGYTAVPGPFEIGLHGDLTFSLRSYTSATSHLILTGDHIDQGPQISRDTVAWVNSAGELETRALRVPTSGAASASTR